jgi:hypothetical protein
MKLADTLYRAYVRNDTWDQKKVHMTDEHGHKWYRYDRPAYTYLCEEHKIVAIKTSSIESIPGYEHSEDLDTVLYTDLEEEVYVQSINDPDNSWIGWFTDRVFAEQHLLDHRAKHEDQDEG